MPSVRGMMRQWLENELSGDNVYNKTYITSPRFYIWAAAGVTNAPSDVPMGAVGFNQDGVSTADVYIYDSGNDTWRDTTQSVAGFFGV